MLAPVPRFLCNMCTKQLVHTHAPQAVVNMGQAQGASNQQFCPSVQPAAFCRPMLLGLCSLSMMAWSVPTAWLEALHVHAALEPHRQGLHAACRHTHTPGHSRTHDAAARSTTTACADLHASGLLCLLACSDNAAVQDQARCATRGAPVTVLAAPSPLSPWSPRASTPASCRLMCTDSCCDRWSTSMQP